MEENSSILGSIQFADELSPASKEKLLSRAGITTFHAGTDILHPGDEVSGAYIVRSGAIRVYYVDENAREGTLYWIRPGESCILALNSLFSDLPYPAFAAIDEDHTEIIFLPGEAFREVFAEEPAVQSFLFEQLSSRVFALLRTLEEKMRLPQEERLVLLLLDLADPEGRVQISHDKLARHLGTVREVVSRLLRNLSAQGLVELSHGCVRIKNRPGLEALLPVDLALEWGAED